MARSNTSPAAFAQRIRSARKGVRATQQALADAVGVTRPAIAQWEAGETRHIKPENLLRACRFLGIRTEWLVFGEDPVRPEAETVRPINERALTEIIEAMEQVLGEEKLSLSPRKKAELIGALYGTFASSGQMPDQSTVGRLARLAA